MEDIFRAAIISNGGLWPVIGTAVVVGATFGAWGWHIKDSSPVLAFGCALAVLAAVLYVGAGYSLAKSQCKSLATQNIQTYYQDNCQEITHCQLQSQGGSFTGTPAKLTEVCS